MTMTLSHRPALSPRGRVFARMLAYLALCGVEAWAQMPFTGLSAEERAALAAGSPVTRIARNAAGLAVPDYAPGAKALIADIVGLKPNYLVETIAVFADDGRNLGAILSSSLSNPESWLKIPYISQRKKKLYDLFDKCVVRQRTATGPDRETFEVLHHMKPFDDYSSKYERESDAGSVVFSGVNTSPLVYKGIKAVEPNCMKWRLSAWKEGAYWYFYGVGAVKAFDMFGLVRDQLEPSFIGRTKVFFDFMRERLDPASPQ